MLFYLPHLQPFSQLHTKRVDSEVQVHSSGVWQATTDSAASELKATRVTPKKIDKDFMFFSCF